MDNLSIQFHSRGVCLCLSLVTFAGSVVLRVISKAKQLIWKNVFNRGNINMNGLPSNRFENTLQSDWLSNTRSRTSVWRINCVVQYSPLGREFGSIIKKHWHIIDSDPALKCLTTSPRIVYKRAFQEQVHSL